MGPAVQPNVGFVSEHRGGHWGPFGVHLQQEGEEGEEGKVEKVEKVRVCIGGGETRLADATARDEFKADFLPRGELEQHGGVPG